MHTAEVEATQIVETLHEPLLVLDENYIVRQANPAFYDAFPTPADDVVGNVLFEVNNGQFRDSVLRERLTDVVENDTSFKSLELECSSRASGRRVLRLNGRRVEGRDAGSVRVLLAIEDVTAQRDLEEKLREHTRELERSNADLEQFAYAASHDLQEPLRMVSSYLQLLERRYKDDLDDTAQEFIEYAVDGAQRMKSLINSLLQYSRVGRKESEFRRVDLGVLVDGIIDDLGRRIEETNAQIDRGELPTTYGNPDQLRRVFQNLIENGITYHGDTPPRIHIDGEGDGEGVHVTVRDEGPGIPEEAREKIFGIFKQLDPHGDGQDGSGMGLAISRKIVERHGGRIWVESEPGEGATFHVTLHLAPEDHDLDESLE